jgi:hypothetical protein
MVLDSSSHARRRRRKRWNRIYTNGARGAGSLRGALTGNDARLIVGAGGLPFQFQIFLAGLFFCERFFFAKGYSGKFGAAPLLAFERRHGLLADDPIFDPVS